MSDTSAGGARTSRSREGQGSLGPLDGPLALSGGLYSNLRLWEVATGRHLRSLKTYSYEHHVNSVFIGLDGRSALSGDRSGYMRFWDTSTGKCLREFTLHTDREVTS